MTRPDELERLRQERDAWRRSLINAHEALKAGRHTTDIELAIVRDRQRIAARFPDSGEAGSTPESPASLPTTGGLDGEGVSVAQPATPEVTA